MRRGQNEEKGITISRLDIRDSDYSIIRSRVSAGRLPGGPVIELGVPFVTRDKLRKKTAVAFANIPATTKKAVQAPTAFGCEGYWLAATAAFCQVVERLSGGHDLLIACTAAKNDIAILRQHYEALQDLVSEKTNEVELPGIRNKSLTELKKLYVRADTWEGGGRPTYVNRSIFLRIIGHCVGFTYGQLMAGAHRYLTKARWADDLFIHFRDELEATATEDQLIQGIEDTLAVSVFHQRECDLRVWGHRFGDLMASTVSGLSKRAEEVRLQWARATYLSSSATTAAS
ncbi:hypothetical protein G7Y89_g9477 [Cudoniella acicularis]|uniref:Uncharacterized protein n=1 Tax=Cudoniella acicularis TaxID=354080 RepID=A0A8H4RIA0_9HELO|nr:hypothetical protein G7Y89_g9477 [Cudoniella acicularis]